MKAETGKQKAESRCIIKLGGTRLVLAEKPSGEKLAMLCEVFSGARLVAFRYKYNEPRNESIEAEVFEDAAEISIAFKGGEFLEEADWAQREAEFQAKNAGAVKGGEA